MINQRILLISSVENITFGHKQKVLITETYMARELPYNETKYSRIDQVKFVEDSL